MIYGDAHVHVATVDICRSTGIYRFLNMRTSTANFRWIYEHLERRIWGLTNRSIRLY